MVLVSMLFMAECSTLFQNYCNQIEGNLKTSVSLRSFSAFQSFEQFQMQKALRFCQIKKELTEIKKRIMKEKMAELKETERRKIILKYIRAGPTSILKDFVNKY